MIWSICGCVNEDGKHRINVYIRGLESVFPVKDTVYHYYVDNNYCKFKHWEEKLSMNAWEYITECVSFCYLFFFFMLKKRSTICMVYPFKGALLNKKQTNV